MSTETDSVSTPEAKQAETLDELYELREELATVAGSDTPYAKYARNALDALEEAGYDV